MLYSRRKRGFSQRLQEAQQKASVRAEERLANIRTVKVFGCEEQEAARFDELMDGTASLASDSASADGLFMGGLSLAGFTSMLMVVYFGGSQVKDGKLSSGKLTAFAIHSSMVGLGASGLATFWKDLMAASMAAQRVFSLMDTIKQSPPAVPTLEPSAASGLVSFNNVRFAYPTRPGTQVLDGLTFSLEPGRVVAIAGVSGAGKSTIIHLLTRLYDLDGERAESPDSGEITLDGIPIHPSAGHPGIAKQWLQDRIGVVSQEPALFSGTIQDNILYGCPAHIAAGWTDEQKAAEVQQAARIANAAEFIEDRDKLPQGYATEVGQHGAMLSGGQKQRIAIARAVIRKPAVLILDEATSSLDQESERQVQEALDHMMCRKLPCEEGHTKQWLNSCAVLVVAHRQTTIDAADAVFYLHGGKLSRTRDQ